MHPQLPEDMLVKLLRQCYFTHKCRPTVGSQQFRQRFKSISLRTSPRHVRQYKTRPSSSELTITPLPVPAAIPTRGPEDIAILGAGITGLACAYYLSKVLPNANLTLYEASDRMGGWLRSKRVDVGNGKVILEQGPRNIRPHTPSGLVTLELIRLLGLEDEIITTAKKSVAAQSRFIYYPDRLVRMPGPGGGVLKSLWQYITEPIFQGTFSGLVADYQKPRRPSDLKDESVGSFLQRRCGNSHVGDNLVSAVCHGIYAGDIYQLSIRSVLPALWQMEGHFGSLVAGMKLRLVEGVRVITLDDVMTLDRARKVDLAGCQKAYDSSVYSFKQGIGALSDGLVTALKSNPKIHLRIGEKIKNIAFDGKANGVKISTCQDEPPKTYNQAISTIPGRALSQLTNPGSELPSLSKIHSVTVMVVNLYYSNPALLPVHGFGYLIPRSIPWNQNPERALGVVFDSDANIGQDTVPGTKVTVMLGGHWWDDWASYPDEAEGATMAKAVLKRHLNIDEEPVVINVGLQRECIPQYTVGHEERMKRAHHELIRGFKGKLAVAGNSYTGVGLNDCVRAARDLAEAVARRGIDGVTGLESFKTDPLWILVPGKSLFTRRSKSAS